MFTICQFPLDFGILRFSPLTMSSPPPQPPPRKNAKNTDWTTSSRDIRISEHNSIRKKRKGAHIAKRRYTAPHPPSTSPTPPTSPSSHSQNELADNLQLLQHISLADPSSFTFLSHLSDILTLTKTTSVPLDTDLAISTAGGPFKIYPPLTEILTNNTIPLTYKLSAALILTNLTATSDIHHAISMCR